jgi:hypothetical protein
VINPHWQNGFEATILHDVVTDRWWFRLELVGEIAQGFEFDSEIVYSTRDDAEQAAADASTIASQYQAWCISDAELTAASRRDAK